MEPVDGKVRISLRAVTFYLNLSLKADLIEAAANLFHPLRAADALSQGRPVSIAHIPHHGPFSCPQQPLAPNRSHPLKRWVMCGIASR